MQSQYTPACHMTERKETGRVIQNKTCSFHGRAVTLWVVTPYSLVITVSQRNILPHIQRKLKAACSLQTMVTTCQTEPNNKHNIIFN